MQPGSLRGSVGIARALASVQSAILHKAGNSLAAEAEEKLLVSPANHPCMGSYTVASTLAPYASTPWCMATHKVGGACRTPHTRYVPRTCMFV